VLHEGKTIYENEKAVTFTGHNGEPNERFLNYVYQPWYDLKGNVQGVLNFAIDTTDQVRARQKVEDSERQFRSVLQRSPSIFLILAGREMRIAFANRPLLESWGKDESILGRPLLEVLPELADQPFPIILDKVYTTGEAHYGYEEKAVVIKNGKPTELFYNYAYLPVQESDGPITGVNVMATDMTEQVVARIRVEESERKYRELSEQLEAIVQERTNELQRSNDDLQQFAHVASHDLKEPLRKLRTFINRLTDEFGSSIPAKGQGYIEKLHAASLRMYDMIDGVLRYSSINQGEQVIESVSINELIESIESDLEMVIQQKHAVIDKANLGHVQGARILLHQLFYNLINNALKFSKDVPHIDITAHELMRDNIPMIEIRVADNGIGFSPEYADMIFHAFSRLNSKDKFEGTGLGLALCRKIAERHH